MSAWIRARLCISCHVCSITQGASRWMAEPLAGSGGGSCACVSCLERVTSSNRPLSFQPPKPCLWLSLGKTVSLGGEKKSFPGVMASIFILHEQDNICDELELPPRQREGLLWCVWECLQGKVCRGLETRNGLVTECFLIGRATDFFKKQSKTNKKKPKKQKTNRKSKNKYTRTTSTDSY